MKKLLTISLLLSTLLIGCGKVETDSDTETNNSETHIEEPGSVVEQNKNDSLEDINEQEQLEYIEEPTTTQETTTEKQSTTEHDHSKEFTQDELIIGCWEYGEESDGNVMIFTEDKKVYMAYEDKQIIDINETADTVNKDYTYIFNGDTVEKLEEYSDNNEYDVYRSVENERQMYITSNDVFNTENGKVYDLYYFADYTLSGTRLLMWEPEDSAEALEEDAIEMRIFFNTLDEFELYQYEDDSVTLTLNRIDFINQCLNK